ERVGANLTHDVVVDRISIADKIHELVHRLEQEGSFAFESCFAASAALPPGVLRHRLVVTFLALLEMTRLRMIRLYQPEACRSILIARATDDFAIGLSGLRSEEYSG